MNAQSDKSSSTSSSASGSWNPDRNPSSTAQVSKALEHGSAEFQELRDDLNSLKETMTKFIAQASEDATKAARSASANVTAQMSGAAASIAERGSDLAAAATEQAKTFASELENMGRRNPLGAIAAAVMVGILIGLLGRGRS